jgi:hypothetical protein
MAPKMSNCWEKWTAVVFSGRYKSQLVEGSGTGYPRTACDYVHLNPVRAWLRRETTLTIKAIAARVWLGTSKGANANLRQMREGSKPRKGKARPAVSLYAHLEHIKMKTRAAGCASAIFRVIPVACGDASPWRRNGDVSA